MSAALDLTALADLTSAYDELAARPLPDAAALAAWLRAWSELESLLDEDQTRRAIAMSRATDDPAALADHLDFQTRIAPHCKPLRDRLARRLLAHPHAGDLDPAHHACLLRGLADAVALHRDVRDDRVDLPALEAEEQRLTAETQRLRAGMTVAWDGATRPVALVDAALDHPDRARREAAWRAASARWTADKPALDALFDRLLAVRHAQAAACGFADARAYYFHRLGRRDYGQGDCLALHAAIATHVVPLAGELLARRRAALDLGSVRPWDLAAPLAGAAAPLHDEHTLVAGCARALAGVDLDLAAQFTRLARHGHLDLMSRPGKSPGAWQAHLEATGLPFVFASVVGRREDVWTVLHEAGHALHALACADDPLIWNRAPPREFAEFAATATELLAGAHLEPLLGAAASDAARREHLEQLVLDLPHIACIDAFQHWLYTDPEGADRSAARDMMWLDLHTTHFPDVDWQDLEPERAALWQRQGHVYIAPFYYLEYALAQLAALALLERWQTDPAATVAEFRGALALGARASLPDLFAAAGVRLDFSAAGVAARMAFVRRALAE
jgi:oligoendopeptidase F